jgi:hypothetical protein
MKSADVLDVIGPVDTRYIDVFKGRVLAVDSAVDGVDEVLSLAV